LQPDGDIKGNNSFLIEMNLSESKWKVDGDNFIIFDKNDKEDQKLTIIERSDEGFTLEKDKFLIYFKKN
jgi:hypothetical protein